LKPHGEQTCWSQTLITGSPTRWLDDGIESIDSGDNYDNGGVDDNGGR